MNGLFDVAHFGTSAVHVLVLGDRYPDDPTCRDWTIEHPPDCPVAHHTGWSWVPWLGLMPYHATHLNCPVQWELDGIDIDGLEDDYGRDWRELALVLPAGRYLVEAWWHDGYGSGEYGGQGDGDSRFTLLGPETPLALTCPPDLLDPARLFAGVHWWRP